MGEQIRQDKHQILEAVTDECYSETVFTAQFLRRRLYRTTRGPIRTAALEFYDSFGLLFDMTSTRSEMLAEATLNDKISKWLRTRSLNGDEELIEQGLALFREYNALLWKKGVLAVRR